MAPSPEDTTPEAEVTVEAEAEEATPADDWTPPSREEWEETIGKLQTASGEAANRRKWLKAAGYNPKTGEKIQPDEPEPQERPTNDSQPQGLSQADVKRQVDRAVAEAKIEGMRGAKKLASNFFTALSDAGWNGTRFDLIMPLADLDGADPEDLDDLAERVDSVKKLFPEGFAPVKRTRQVSNPSNGAGGSGQNGVTPAKVEAADKPAPKPEPKGWAEVLAARTLRG